MPPYRWLSLIKELSINLQMIKKTAFSCRVSFYYSLARANELLRWNFVLFTACSEWLRQLEFDELLF